jgi:hypothetical protein
MKNSYVREDDKLNLAINKVKNKMQDQRMSSTMYQTIVEVVLVASALANEGGKWDKKCDDKRQTTRNAPGPGIYGAKYRRQWR